MILEDQMLLTFILQITVDSKEVIKGHKSWFRCVLIIMVSDDGEYMSEDLLLVVSFTNGINLICLTFLMSREKKNDQSLLSIVYKFGMSYIMPLRIALSSLPFAGICRDAFLSLD